VERDPTPDVPLLAGMAGLDAGRSQTSHQNRRALLLTRETDTAEFEALAATLGINIVETIFQRGKPAPRVHLGRGKIEEIAEQMGMRNEGHPWDGIDLILVHHNTLPRQLVNLDDALGMEVWDRVRLLLELFTQHAASVEARVQVRIARLLADRSILRELVHRETMGERLGYGAGGRTGWRSVMEATQFEIARLRRRQKKFSRSLAERRRQRVRSGALSVGVSGYTNAGKSLLFSALTGKPVLIQDQVFSTLETTVGRMEKSPRVLLIDTIGFIDRIPADLLDAFSATLREALTCDLLLLLVDASDTPNELRRKLATSRRELFERMEEAVGPQTLILLTKADLCDEEDLRKAVSAVEEVGLLKPLIVSAHTGAGLEELRAAILTALHGPPLTLTLSTGEEPLTALIARVHREAMVIDVMTRKDKTEIRGWIDEASAARLEKEHPEQVEINS